MKIWIPRLAFLLLSLGISAFLFFAVPLVNVLMLDSSAPPPKKLEALEQTAVEVSLPKPKVLTPPVPHNVKPQGSAFKPQASFASGSKFQMDLSLASGGDGVYAQGGGGAGEGNGTGGVGGGTGLGAAVYEPGQVDQQAKVLQEVAPNYPPRARKEGLAGSVKLYLVVDVRGNATEIQVLSVNPPGYGFENEAIKALRQYRFAPARLQDVPVAQKFTKEFLFDLGY